MELLKKVAKDRLVVMVTHNPELAQLYATRIVKLKDGKITTVPIAYKTTLYGPQNITCTDADGNEISEEEFAEAPDRYFAGCQKTVTSLGWQDVKELDTEIEKIKEQIRISEKIFTNLIWED